MVHKFFSLGENFPLLSILKGINTSGKIIIFLPCLLVFFLFCVGNKGPEFFNRGSLQHYGFADCMSYLYENINIRTGEAYGGQFTSESGPEFCFCNDNVISVSQPPCSPIGYKSPNDCEPTPNKSNVVSSSLHFNGTRLEFYGWAAFGALIGMCVVLPMNDPFY